MGIHSINGILVLVVLVRLSLFSAAQEADSSKDFCSAPFEAKNINQKWIKENFINDWYVQIGNTAMRNYIGQWLREKEMLSEDEFAGMCPRELVKQLEPVITGNYNGYDRLTVDWSCTTTKHEINFRSATGVYENSAKYYLTYFDDSEVPNMVAYVKCFPNGKTGMYAVTLSRSISEEEKKTAIEHFKSLGFEKEHFISLQPPSCP